MHNKNTPHRSLRCGPLDDDEVVLSFPAHIGLLLEGVVPTGEIHLKRQCAPEGLLTGGTRKGEFHEIAQPASEALLTGVALSREIHLERQCASEGIVEGVRL